MSELTDALQDITSQPTATLRVCTVIAVDKETVDVRPLDGTADYLGLRMRPRGSKGVAKRLVAGSEVVVLDAPNSPSIVLATSEIDRLMLQDTKVSAEAHGEDLYSVLIDLLGWLKDIANDFNLLKHITPAGPTTGLDPASLQIIEQQKISLQLIENRLKKFIAPYE